jgi:SAM-dependent methyltransferase
MKPETRNLKIEKRTEYRQDSVAWDYYEEKLSAERLRRCYEIAPPRVQQYLQAEITHVLSRVRPDDLALELGCGYGRALIPFAEAARFAIGIDNSISSLLAGLKSILELANCRVSQMDVAKIGFRDHSFDIVICIQNGLSAFHIDHRILMREAIRVVKPGGRILLSSYADRFWDHRLEWFRLQVKEGLLGEIDETKMGDGRIVCKDGFSATTVSEGDFRQLASAFDAQHSITEVDGSSLFCEMIVRG